MPTVYQGSISLAKVKDGESGGPGEHGINTATIYLYRRSVGVPSAMPIGNLTYTFATGIISATESGGSLNGWVQNIGSLSGTDPLYFIAAVASATTDTDLIASSEWQGPTLMAQDGEDGQDGRDGQDGQDGQPGVNGFNQATISLYQRVNSTPSVPSGNLTYTFSNGELSGNLGNWSREVPTNTNGYPCYVISAAAINREAQDIIASSDWSSPVVMVEDGEDGEDGFSPTATVTKNGNIATITITDKNGTTTQTVTDGASGTSYYTYIRYSSKVVPTSASDVSELPDGKDYFGIQTTTSSTAPAWNDSNWHWTKYIGEEGERGVSVTKTQEIYYLTNGNAPTKPIDGVEITSTSTAADIWTKAIPTYVANYKYYTSVQTFLSSGTSPISSTSVLNNGLTDANYTADRALSIAQGVKQYFWFQGSDYSTSIPAGTYITQIPEASFKNNLNNQPNLLLRSTSINLRYGANTHAQLTSTGLNVLKGGVQAGTSRTDNFVYLSSDNFNEPISGHSNGTIALDNYTATDWREIIGTKFGVRADGTLYAANANIDGHIVARSLTINGDNRDYNGVAALNITSYQIEIRKDAEHQSITDVDTQIYLYPLLYHNGELVTGITYTKFVWYKDDETIGTQGSAIDGGILAFYGHTYRVEYDFEDAEVDEGREIQTREIDPTKYITQTAPDGIVLHPEVQNNTTTIQLNGTGLDIIKNGISVAKYGETARIGRDNNSRFLMNSNSLQAYDNNNQKYFEVTANGLMWGNKIAATNEDINNALSKYIVDISEGGIYIHSADTPADPSSATAKGIKITDKIDIIRDGISSMAIGELNSGNENEIIRIGNIGENRIEMDYHSLQMKDRENNTYFYVSDLRNKEGYITIKETPTINTGSDHAYNITQTPIPSDSLIAKVDGSTNSNWQYVGDTPAAHIIDFNHYKALTGNGTTKTFSLPYYIDHATQIKINNTVQSLTNITYYNKNITFPTAPPSNSNIEIWYDSLSAGTHSISVTYTTSSSFTKAFTFGQRSATHGIGGYSVSLGDSNVASGLYSYAEGYLNRVYADYSHAEGYSNNVEKQYSHAEGQDNDNRGYTSHAEGRDTYITSNAQYAHAEGYLTTCEASYGHVQNQGTSLSYSNVAGTAIGKYNTPIGYSATIGDILLYIGNGTSQTNTSNALIVGNNGNVFLGYDNSAGSGVDYNLKQIITNKGWASEVLLDNKYINIKALLNKIIRAL